MLHAITSTLKCCITLGGCAVVALCTLYVTRPTAQSNASPIYGVTIPAGYRNWKLIAVAQLTTDKVNQLRAQLGNEIAVKAFKEGMVPFPDGTIIAALHWNLCPVGRQRRSPSRRFPGRAIFRRRVSRKRSVHGQGTQKSTPQRVVGGSVTLRTESLATRHCTKPASPATSLPKLATSFSLVTQLRLKSKHAP